MIHFVFKGLEGIWVVRRGWSASPQGSSGEERRPRPERSDVRVPTRVPQPGHRQSPGPMDSPVARPPH